MAVSLRLSREWPLRFSKQLFQHKQTKPMERAPSDANERGATVMLCSADSQNNGSI